MNIYQFKIYLILSYLSVRVLLQAQLIGMSKSYSGVEGLLVPLKSQPIDASSASRYSWAP